MNTNKPTTETNKAIDALCAERDAYKAKCAQLNAKIQELSALIDEREDENKQIADKLKDCEEQLRAANVAVKYITKQCNKYSNALRGIGQMIKVCELPKE